MPVGKGSILRATNASSKTVTTLVKETEKVLNTTENIPNILSNIPVDQIIVVPDKWPGQRNLKYNVSNLVESIRRYGLIEPVILRRVKENQFQILSGYKRFQAIRELGMETITARILDKLDEKKAKDIFEELHKNNATDTTTDTIHATKFQMVSTSSREMPTYLL